MMSLMFPRRSRSLLRKISVQNHSTGSQIGRFLGAFDATPPITSIASLRCFSQEVSTNNDATKSKRRLFRDMEVHPHVLNYIQMIGLGIPSSRSMRNDNHTLPPVRRARRRTTAAKGRDKASLLSSQWNPPSPFGLDSLPVQLIGSVEIQPTVQDENDDDESKTDKNQWPRNQRRTPEVAVVGRSNVGKSTLLNALVYGNRRKPAVDGEAPLEKRRGKTPDTVKLPKGQKAATSDRPGETRSIDFYQLQQAIPQKSEDDDDMIRRLILVDLPGYGFAYASEAHATQFRQMIASYLLERDSRTLKRILLLVDARHGMKKADFDFLEGLQEQMRLKEEESNAAGGNSKSTRQRRVMLPPIQVVLTKCDLVTQTDLARRVTQARQQLSDCLYREPSSLPVMLVSARAGVGFNNLKGNRAVGGVLELQKELSALVVPRARVKQRTGDENTSPESASAK